MTVEPRCILWLLTIGLLSAGQLGCGSSGKTDIQTDPSSATEAVSEPPPPGTRFAPATAAEIIEDYMARQADEFAAIDAAKTEIAGDTIRVTWSSDVLFGFDSAMLSADAQPQIQRMADIFQRYPDTNIIVAGHTDSQGDEDYNFTLSERRALSVRNYLIDAGVPPERIETVGYGEFRPAAPNNTEDGRRQNRRVEVEVHPSETLKSRAAATQ